MRKVLKISCICITSLLLLCVCVHIFIYCSNYRHTKELLQAIEHEDVCRVRELLDKGIDPNRTNIPPSKFWDFLETSPKRPLAIACRCGNLEIVELLLEYGATAEPVAGTGFSPLRETLFYFQPDDVQIVKLLLENGAGTEAKYGEDIVFAAAQMVPRVYDKTKTNGTVFADDYDEMTAIGITEIVSDLLNGGSVDVTNKAGKTLLMVGAEKENLYLAEYLIKAGCETSVTDMHGKTALDYALESGNEDLILILRRSKTGDGLREPF